MQITDFLTDEKENITDYNITEMAANEWKSFALYTTESRAIPNMIDGLKPVNRFYLYSSIVNSKKEFKKVSAISGVVSDYGYNHGETSAASAGQLMAAEWSNNICLIEGRGSFGTRLIQAAAAARYTYSRLASNFDKYIKDLDLSPVHADPEHEPPAFYLPIIPLVLANGTKGIATGFATSILSRDPADLIIACKEYIETGKITERPRVKFPHFTGIVEYKEEENRYYCYGEYEKKGKVGLLITEIPYGFDREGYIAVLDDLEDKDLIVGYDDLCDKNGFGFEVKLKQSTSANWTDEEIIKQFKLCKTYVENLTVIDQNGRLKEYESELDLIKDFCDFRQGILAQRIQKRLDEYNEEVRWLTAKYEFIESILEEKLLFKGKKKDVIAKEIVSLTSALPTDTDRLLRLNIASLTQEQVTEAKKDIAETKKLLTFWKKTTVKEQFLSDLSEL